MTNLQYKYEKAMAQVLTPEGLHIVYNCIQIHSHYDYRQQTGIWFKYPENQS